MRPLGCSVPHQPLCTPSTLGATPAAADSKHTPSALHPSLSPRHHLSCLCHRIYRDHHGRRAPLLGLHNLRLSLALPSAPPWLWPCASQGHAVVLHLAVPPYIYICFYFYFPICHKISLINIDYRSMPLIFGDNLSPFCHRNSVIICYQILSPNILVTICDDFTTEFN